jgi:peptide/nickel transport system substrate-binding protein
MTKHLSIPRLTAFVILFLLMLAQGTSTGFAHTSQLQQTGTTTLHVALTIEPDTFNVYTSTLAIEDVFINAFYDTLYVEGLDYAMHPKLATGYTISPNGTVWTVSIVHNATFSDNTPVTAEDVKYSYDLAGMSEIDHIQVVDDYTLDIYFKAPYVEDYVLRSIFANYYGKVLPEHVWSKVSDPYSFRNKEAIGSGPWILDTWVEGQYLKMRANPTYWGGRPKLDFVIFNFIPSLDTQVLSLESGSADMIYVDPAYVATLIGVPNVNVTITPQLRNNYISFNLKRYPINVKEFRHALAYALDPKTLVHNALFGFGIPGQQGWCTPGDPVFYNPDITQYPYNLTMANQILDNLGWKMGADGIRSTTNGTKLAFDLLTPSDTPTTIRIGEFIRDQFAKIGVKLNVVAMTTKTIISQEFAGKYSLSMMGWFSISVEPSVDMRWHFLPGAFFNVYGYNSSEFNTLFAEYKVAPTFAEYRNKILQMQQVLSDDLPILIYSFTPSISAYRTDKFQGWITPVMSDDTLQGILNWYSLQNLHPPTAPETMTQSTTEQSTEQPTAATTIPDWAWWVVGIVIVAALVAAVVSRRKKRS